MYCVLLSLDTLGIALLETNENGGHVLILAKMSLAMLLFIKFLLGLIGGLSMVGLLP